MTTEGWQFDKSLSVGNILFGLMMLGGFIVYANNQATINATHSVQIIQLQDQVKDVKNDIRDIRNDVKDINNKMDQLLVQKESRK